MGAEAWIRLGDLAAVFYVVVLLVVVPLLVGWQLLRLLMGARRSWDTPAIVRVANERDEALNKLDEVAQRLRRCTCAVGQAIAAELEGR